MVQKNTIIYRVSEILLAQWYGSINGYFLHLTCLGMRSLHIEYHVGMWRGLKYVLRNYIPIHQFIMYSKFMNT